MQRQILDLLHRLITRPDGTARLSRVNVVLVALIAMAAGIVPAFAITADTPTDPARSTTTTAANAPIVAGAPTTTAAKAATPTTSAKAATPTTAAPATPSTTAKPTGKQPGVVYEEDSDTPVSASTNAPVALGRATGAAPNPGWPTTCNTNVAMLMDRSSSMGDPTYGGNVGNTLAVKAAASNFVTALSGKKGEPRLYVNAFATYVKPVYQWFGHTYLAIPTTPNILNASAQDAINKINATPFATGEPYPADYGPGTGRGRTNWQGALADVPAGAGLVIMITDGEPTWWNGANWATNNGATQPEDVLHAIEQANALKAAGTRIVAVHVGQERGAWETNLAAISGPQAGSDYFVTSYAGLDGVLAKIGNLACTAKTATIKLEKTANKSSAKPGDTVSYSFKVTNTGTATLAPVAVVDDKIGSIGTIASLAAGASDTLTKNYVVPNGVSSVVNTATACGKNTDAPSDPDVCATDNHTLNVLSIKVEKSANKTSAQSGDKVTYSFKVTNTSAVTLTNIAVTDNVLGTIGTIPSLAAGANTTLTKDFTVPAGTGPIQNTVTACAPVPGSTDPANKICDTDNHTLPRLSIGLTKTASVPTANVGDTVTYTYIVTNTSGTTLNNIVLTDDKLGKVTLPVTSLAAGAVTTGTAQYTVKLADAGSTITNVATVVGTDPNGNSVSATAKAQVAIPNQQGTVVTTTPTPEVKGTSLAYTGAGTSSLIRLSFVLMAVGGALLGLTRLRRRSTATDGRSA